MDYSLKRFFIRTSEVLDVKIKGKYYIISQNFPKQNNAK
jgi:hypothetical protein